MTTDSIHEPRNAPNDCAGCGHEFATHDLYGRCTGYHCRCRGFRAKRGA